MDMNEDIKMPDLYQVDIYFRENPEGELKMVDSIVYRSFIKAFTDIICEFSELYSCGDAGIRKNSKESSPIIEMAAGCFMMNQDNTADIFVFEIGKYRFEVGKILYGEEYTGIYPGFRGLIN